MKTPKNLFGIECLTLRALVLAGLGSALITASSMYVALRMSALPWPTIFVSVLSLSVLRLFGKTNNNEINIAQTGMSAGAMVAGGICFTLPALWITGERASFDHNANSFQEWMLPQLGTVLALSFAGVILGTIICAFFRNKTNFIHLPYPIGKAAAETIENANEGGQKGLFIAISLGFATLFTLMRDGVKWFPDTLSAKLGGFALGLPLALALSPMAMGIGYIIGFGATAFWLVGALCRHFVLDLLLIHHGIFTDLGATGAFALSLAVGLIVGAGIAIIFGLIKVKISDLTKPKIRHQNSTQAHTLNANHNLKRLLPILVIAISYVLTLLAGLSPLVATLCLVGVAFASILAATITGQTGINPMEIFGIIILLGIRIFVPVSTEQAIFIAAIVAIACGYAGDMMNDYKTGVILGTAPKAQIASQIVGGFVGAIVSSITLFAIIAQFGGVGNEFGLSATQAFTVSAMIQGLPSVTVFAVGVGVGILLQLCRIPAMIVGIGLLLPLGISTAIFLGGLICLISNKYFAKVPGLSLKGNIIAAGLLGGEGFAGTCIALYKMFGG